MKKELLGADAAAVGNARSASESDAASHVAPKYTPGPWMVEPHSDQDEVVNVVSQYEVMPDGIKRAHWIAELDAQIDFDSDVEQQLVEVNANAHLISAAPELYEVVRMVANSSMCGTKSDPPESWIGWQFSQGGINAAYRVLEKARAAIAKAEGRDLTSVAQKG